MYLVVQLVHRTKIFHVDRDLLARLAVQHREAIVHLDLRLSARPNERSDHTILFIFPSQIVIQDGEERDRMDRDTLDRASEQNPINKMSDIHSN